MIIERRAADRGHTQIDWLDSWHTFSFGEYHDPAHMGFRALRVINDDRVRAGGGFATHGHRDMEIITYVLQGALEHKDSLGNGSIIQPGDAQRMSAGTGIQHSEFNHSRTQPVHFLQIWILPEHQGLPPGYEQKAFVPEELQGQLRLIAAPDARHGAITVHQDVDVYAARLSEGQKIQQALRPERHFWLHVASGELSANGHRLGGGDAIAMSRETELQITARTGAELLLFDLA